MSTDPAVSMRLYLNDKMQEQYRDRAHDLPDMEYVGSEMLDQVLGLLRPYDCEHEFTAVAWSARSDRNGSLCGDFQALLPGRYAVF